MIPKEEEEEEFKEIKDEIEEKKLSVFHLNVNEAMAKKALIPSITVIISVEAEPTQEDEFWKDSRVLEVITSDFVVCRLSQTVNLIEILYFSQIFVIKSVPSLYIFGPYSQGVSYAWPEKYPSVDEFVIFFQNSEDAMSKADFSSLVHPPPPPPPPQPISPPPQPQPSTNIPSYQRQQQINPQQQNAIRQNTTQQQSVAQQQNATRQNVQQPENDPIPVRPFPHQQAPKPASRRSARISVQGPAGRTIAREFQPDDTVGMVVDWIESNFGRGFLFFVLHKNGFLTADRNKTVTAADLVPSALIRLQTQGDQTFQPFSAAPRFATTNNHNNNNNNNNNASNSNDEVGNGPSLDIEESLPALGHTDTTEVVPTLNDGQTAAPPQRRCRGWGMLRSLFSIFNPWGDVEEVEDFFEVKEFRT